MANKTFDLDDYISQRKEKDSEFAKDFDAGYEEFKIGMMIKKMRLESGMTQEQLAAKIGTTGQYVNRVIKKKDGFLNKTFVEIMEALGYDIELTYVKREGL